MNLRIICGSLRGKVHSILKGLISFSPGLARFLEGLPWVFAHEFHNPERVVYQAITIWMHFTAENAQASSKCPHCNSAKQDRPDNLPAPEHPDNGGQSDVWAVGHARGPLAFAQ